MQLTIEVLPAPLGPMIENSSPPLTPKLTSVSARTPPKRKETERTSNVWSKRPSRLPPQHSGAFRALCLISLKLQHDPISAFPVKPCDEWQLLNRWYIGCHPFAPCPGGAIGRGRLA